MSTLNSASCVASQCSARSCLSQYSPVLTYEDACEIEVLFSAINFTLVIRHVPCGYRECSSVRFPDEEGDQVPSRFCSTHSSVHILVFSVATLNEPELWRRFEEFHNLIRFNAMLARPFLDYLVKPDDARYLQREDCAVFCVLRRASGGPSATESCG